MDEFTKAWVDLQKTIIAPKPIEYRIYYDPNSGQILNYTNECLEGTYILVSREIFSHHRFEYKIKNGKLIAPTQSVGKLLPDKNGTPCHPLDITIIVTDSNAQHWKNHTYDD